MSDADPVVRAARLRTRLDAGADARRRAERLATTARDVARTVRFFAQVGSGLAWLWARIAAPRRWARVALVLTWRAYRRTWDRAVYARIEGVRVFRPHRAALTILATVGLLWFFVFPLGELAGDSALYLATGRVNEPIYLRAPQELDPTTSVHAVRGCHALPCDDADAVYFRIESDWFSNLWSLAHGRGFFFPEYVAAAVPTETTRCVVSSFGIRLRGTVRLLNWFPQLLAVSCG